VDVRGAGPNGLSGILQICGQTSSPDMAPPLARLRTQGICWTEFAGVRKAMATRKTSAARLRGGAASTAFRWRHPAFPAGCDGSGADQLRGIVEADETFVFERT